VTISHGPLFQEADCAAQTYLFIVPIGMLDDLRSHPEHGQCTDEAEHMTGKERDGLRSSSTKKLHPDTPRPKNPWTE
jgi:hypothetical protein